MSRTAIMSPAAAEVSAWEPARPRDQGRRLVSHFRVAALFGDTLIVFLSLAASSWLRFETRLAGFGRNFTAIRAEDYFGPVIFGTVLFLFLLPHRELYDPQWFLKFRQVAARILHSAIVWLIAFSTLAWLLRTSADVSRVYVLIAFTITTSAFLAWRFVLHQVICADAIAGRLTQRVLFVGWSEPARMLARTILRDGRHPYELAGYLPSRRERRAGTPSVFLRRIGNGENLADTLRTHAIDMMILADTDASAEETMALANLCEKEMVEFKVIATCSQILCSCLRLQTVSGVPVLGVSYFPLENPLNAVTKQVIDMAGAVLGLIASAPIIALFAALVYRESPGPVFYRQRRVGVHGRPFWMYKIRSMRLDAEREGQVGWTVPDDPRRLRIGAFMRRWNIDELPQFWNVLRGDMSLVGPRPERPELIRRFKEEISHYNARHNIKPGITGWAQVNGFRGDTDLHERLRCDLFYIENWSPLLDLQIAVMTLFRHKNAA